MRSIVILAAAAVLTPSCSAPAPAQNDAQAKAPTPVEGGAADPAAWVRQVYEPAGAPGAAPTDQAAQAGYSNTPQFTPRLRALFADDERYANGEVGRLEFNPFSGAQDEDISRLAVTSADVDGAADRTVVTANFRNGDADQTITYFWERIGGLWYIDDITGRTRGEPNGWTLSLILKYGSYGP